MRKLDGTFIGFCGAGGTGKTTTAKALQSSLNGEYYFLPSASREVFQRMGIKTEEDQYNMSLEQRWLLQCNIQIAHMNVMADLFNQPFISDRTQIDQHAYALQYCSTILRTEDLTWLGDLVNRALQFYKVIFYFPLHTFDGQEDGMRTNSLGARFHFDTLLLGLLRKFEVPYIVVPVMPVDNRVKFILETLYKAQD